MARVSGFILEALLCDCSSPGEDCFSSEELVDEFLFGKIFDLSSCAVDDVLDAVIVDALSEDGCLDLSEEDILKFEREKRGGGVMWL